MGSACRTFQKDESAYRTLDGEPEKKRPFGRHRRRWKDNLKTVHKTQDVATEIAFTCLRIEAGGDIF